MRGKQAKKKQLDTDTRYGSILITRLINYIMLNGKKSIAERVVYGALENVGKKVNKTPLEVLEQVIENVGPKKELRSRRVGGANYQVPYDVRGDRRIILALRWVIGSARKKKGKPMETRLTEELLDAFNNTGAAVTKRVNTHKMADANKAFAHFAW